MRRSDCCQLNERKDDGASENTIKHQIDEQTHVSASGRERIMYNQRCGLEMREICNH
jgi:hypothetical protein